jgi:cardiolipin synthase
MNAKVFGLGLGLALGVGLGMRARARPGSRRRGPRGALGPRLQGGVEAVELALLQATNSEMLGGNLLTLCDNGRIFDVLEDEIRQAKHSVHVNMFIFKPGNPGDRLAELLIRRAQQGVAVRVLVDPMGSTNFDTKLYAPLREAGCEVRYFRPLRKYPLAITGRNHRKIVVVDGRVGFTGGFGIASEWTGDGDTPQDWRDTNARIEGPTVRQMQLAFAAHWLESGGALMPKEELTRAAPAGSSRCTFVTSMDVKGLTSARWVTHIAMAAARKSLWIANAYFAPPLRIIDGLCHRSSDGVDVRLLLPGPYQDHPSLTWIQRCFYPRMSRCGVKVYEYQRSMMHAKTMLVDERLSVIGSINLDVLSQGFLEEGALVVDDEAFAAAMKRRYELDLERSLQVTGRLPALPGRPPQLPPQPYELPAPLEV